MNHEVLLTVIGKIILADKKIRSEELAFLEDIEQGLDLDKTDVTALFAKSETTSFKDLAAGVGKDADRLYIAQQAYYTALVDQDFALAEIAAFDDLVQAFGISPDDVQRIKRSAQVIAEGHYDIFMNKDIAYLHANFLHSSFAPES